MSSRYSSAIPATSLGGGTRNGLAEGGYRWRGQPGWNPAALPAQRAGVRHYNEATLARKCIRCDVPPGKRCIGPSGARLGEPHQDRWAGEE